MPINAPNGFTPSRHRFGGLIRANSYRIASGYAADIGTGDAVKLAADGTIQVAAAGDRILGVFNGCNYTASDGTPTFSPRWISGTAQQTGSTVDANVYDDYGIVYEIQSGGTPAVTNIGNLADHVAGAVSAVTGRSAQSLSGTMSTAAAGFRVLDIINKPGNSGQFARLEVQIFEHEFAEHSQATAGV